MTKRQYLESVDFNNSSLKVQVHHFFITLDIHYNTMEDGDENYRNSGINSEELKEANKKLIEDFPMFATIGRYLRENKKLTKGDRNDVDIIYSLMKKEIREENLTKILS